MSRRKNVLMVTTGIPIGLLMAGTAAHTAEAPPIQVSSYKGVVLEVGERSGLIIGPSGAKYTVTPNDPDTVAVEQVMSFWVVVAKAEGSVEITVSNQSGETSALILTVGPNALQAPTTEDSQGQGEAPDVRLELVRLINGTRRENGAAELTVNEALMDAAQNISDKEYSWHCTKEGCEAALTCDYPYGFGANLTMFTGVATEDAAQHTLENWISSPGHFETMVDPDGDSIGVGVAECDGVTYCYLFVGYPNTHNPHGWAYQPDGLSNERSSFISAREEVVTPQ